MRNYSLEIPGMEGFSSVFNISQKQWCDRWYFPLRLCLVHVKYFPENKYFLEMLFLGKENIFKCLVAFQKMFWKRFFGVWLCSWKYHRKHIFYLLLTFSHIFLTAKRNKTQKKNSSNLVRLREEGRERGDWVRSRGKIARRMRRRDHAAEARSSNIGVDLCLIGAVRSAWC